MCDILETAGRRAKWTKIWTSGLLFSVYTCRVLVILSVQVQFGVTQYSTFLILDDLVSQKRLVVERNGPKFGPQV